MSEPIHFIRQLIESDLKEGKHTQVVTRFPPEPNGFLHIGHAKSICLNFGMARLFNGRCLLRFDDTNPMKEESLYVHSIIEDVRWLGFKWSDETYTSDYYQKLYDYAVFLIQKGLAYVDSLSMDEIRSYRGTLQSPGKNSPYRERSIEENETMFARMKDGDYADGEHVLRAKIDMASGNLNMRDPVLYRVRHASHQRTGDNWCIYPMYDYAHPLSDAIEGITHSLCTLEFQDHRPLYDWLIEHLPVTTIPRQTEFSRLNVSHTITSKRNIKALVDEKIVEGWDDPRLLTIRGMRKRGYPAESIRSFCDAVGVSKSDSIIDMSVLEECVRDVLNNTAPRAMCVQDPLKVVIENYPKDKVENLDAALYPNQPESPTRILPFSREIYIERSDFMMETQPGYFRLTLGSEVRLRNAYVIRCNEVICDSEGMPVELRCTFDDKTLGKKPEGRKVKGVIHWVSKAHAYPVTLYLYDRLFNLEEPAKAKDLSLAINDKSLLKITGLAEPALAKQDLGATFQFERVGYFAVNQLGDDNTVSIYHRVVTLKDTWSGKQ